MDILADMNRQDGITVLVSLHQVEYALSYCPRTIALKAGKIVYDGPSDELTPALLSSIYGARASELFLPRAWIGRPLAGSAPVAGQAAQTGARIGGRRSLARG